MRRRILGIFLIMLIILTSIPMDAYANTVLRVGSRGTQVVKMQQRLIDLGYLNGKADGIFGPGTQASVIHFQKAHALTADGIAGSKTFAILYSNQAKALGSGNTAPTPTPTAPSTAPTGTITRVLRRGSQGNDVALLQNKLNEIGYTCGLPDGHFGPTTENAVRAFQQANKLLSDGIVGNQTVTTLFALSPQGPGTSPDPIPPAQITNPITSVLKLGSRGVQVTALQNRLNELKINSGTADGIFGHGTQNAVISFQKSQGLSSDGIVGPATSSKLFANQSSGSGSLPLPTLPGASGSLAGKIIILDPGHGGIDSGAPHGGYHESKLAFDMTIRLKSMLEQAGATVLLTRPDDRFLSLYYRSAFANNVVLDLEKAYVTAKKNSNAALITEKQNTIVKNSQDILALSAYQQSILQLQQAMNTYQANHGFSPTTHVKTLSFMQNSVHAVKDGLINLGIEGNTQELDLLRDTLKQLHTSNDEQKNLKDAMIILLDSLIEAVGEKNTIASIEQGIIDLRMTLGGIITALDNAQMLRAVLALDVRQAISIGQTALEDELQDLSLVLAKIDDAQAQRSSQNIVIGMEVEGLNKEITSYNLQLADIQRKINAFGVYLSKPSLTSRQGIYDIIKNGFQNIANKDLTEVMNLTRDKYQENMIFISIHLNATDEKVTTASGVIVFYRDNTPSSSLNKDYYKNYNSIQRHKLAQKLLEGMNSTTHFNHQRKTVDNADFSVLRENNLVSALVEVGFMNNPKDLQLVAQPAFREKVALGIFKGIVEYFK